MDETFIVMLMELYIRLSWDKVSSLWFWLANCLVFKVIVYCIGIVWDSRANCAIVLVVEKYTVDLDLPPQTVLHGVLWIQGNITKIVSSSTGGLCCGTGLKDIQTFQGFTEIENN